MVGEALAHVQGESLKADAVLLTEAYQLPDHQGEIFIVALIKCKECGESISANAGKCPKCGAPIANKSAAGCMGGCLAVILVMVGIGIFAGSSEDKDVRGAVNVEKAQGELSHAMEDPRKRRLTECIGVQVYKSPPPGWTAPTKEECYELEREMGATENELYYAPLNR